jgi:hypothetical protein
MGQRAFYDGLKGQRAADEEWADGAAFFTGLTKEACGDIVSSINSQKGWIGQFEGSALHGQAVALEREELQMEAQDLARRQQEDAERQARGNEETSRWMMRDQIRLKKRELELQLAEEKEGAATASAQPTAGAEQPVPEMLAPAAEQGAVKMAGLLDKAKDLGKPSRYVPIAALAALGGGYSYLKNRPRAENKGKSDWEIEGEDQLTGQNAQDLDESEMSLPKKLKRRIVEARPGIAKALREHPIASTIAGAAAGAYVGNHVGLNYASGLKKRTP